jgi:glycosyltransferase involved in cell wall biosynthesis
MVSDPRQLRICIDARLVNGAGGGVQQAIMGLASGLSQLADANEQYRFLVYSDARAWLDPFLYGPCSALPCGPAPKPTWKQRLRLFPGVRTTADAVAFVSGTRCFSLPSEPAELTAEAVDVMHFTTQTGFTTSLPTIYQPWDLQHLHLPHLFPVRTRVYREFSYRAFCHQARAVVVATDWTRRDLLEHYSLPGGKVHVIPCAPITREYPDPTHEDLGKLCARHDLPSQFVFYPAQTWRHKNHVALLEALAIARDRYGMRIPLICSGGKTEYFPAIEARITQLGLQDQVKFLGFVDPFELQCLYRLCRCIVFPTLFEGWGMPLLEAFLANAPVACSNIGPLLEQAADATLLFDPHDELAIASALAQLWTDHSLRDRLIKRGRAEATRYSWSDTAIAFRARYRFLSGVSLGSEDTELLRKSSDEPDTSAVTHSVKRLAA